MAQITWNPTHQTFPQTGPNNLEIELGYTPTPKQARMHRGRQRYKCGGGGKGGGKTSLGGGEAWDLLVSYPGNVGFIGRADLNDLLRTTLKEFLSQDRGLILHHHHTQMWIDVATADPAHPSRLYYGELKDPDSQLGQNLGFFIVDEAHEVPRKSWDTLADCLRLKLPDGTFPPYHGIALANPNPCWLMDLFPLTRQQQRQQRDGTWPDPRHGYYPFLAKDNPHLPPDYWPELQAKYANDPVMYNRMVLGIWDEMAEGLVYPFRDYHRWKGRPGTNDRLWRPGVPVSLALDPSGGAAPYAILAIQEIGPYICVIDCYYNTRDGNSDEDAIDWLRSRPWHKEIAEGICDPAARQSIDRFARNGYPVRGMAAKKDIRGQILGVKALMKQNPATGFAQLLIDENYAAPLCTEFGLYSYRRLTDSKRADGALSPEQPEDKNNHAINAFEYWTRDKRPTTSGASFARAEPDTGTIPAYYQLLQER
jgi:hypothetical protein